MGRELEGVTASRAPDRDTARPRCLLTAAFGLWWEQGPGQGRRPAGGGSGVPTPRHTAGSGPQFQRPVCHQSSPAVSLCVSPSPPFRPPFSHVPLGNVKVQDAKPGWTTQPKDQLWLLAPGNSPTLIHPRQSEPGQQKVRAQGLPQSTGEAGSGTQCRKLGRGWRRGRTDRCLLSGMDGAGIHPVQQAGSVFTVRWFPSERGSARPPGGALAGPGGRWGRGQCLVLPWASRGRPGRSWGPGWHPLSAWLPTEGTEASGGYRPAPGDQCRPAGPEAFSSRLLGYTPLREIQQRCPALWISCFSLWRQVPACRCWDPLAAGRSSDTRALPFLSAHPALPCPVGLRGPRGEWAEDIAPEGQRVPSRAWQPSLSGWEPPGPLINISSVGGILQPSLSQSRVWGSRAEEPQPGCSGLALLSRVQELSRWAGHIPGRMVGEGWWWPSPQYLLPWRDCPMCPAVGKRKKGCQLSGSQGRGHWGHGWAS